MGMTINEVIYILENGLNIDGSWQKALCIALDTMRKYQKIGQIVENVDKGYYGYPTMMDYLHEVLEDGNDTTNTGSN